MSNVSHPTQEDVIGFIVGGVFLYYTHNEKAQEDSAQGYAGEPAE